MLATLLAITRRAAELVCNAVSALERMPSSDTRYSNAGSPHTSSQGVCHQASPSLTAHLLHIPAHPRQTLPGGLAVHAAQNPASDMPQANDIPRKSARFFAGPTVAQTMADTCEHKCGSVDQQHVQSRRKCRRRDACHRWQIASA